MGLISEFKEFAMKGSVVDMAVGIIIGAAFGKVVSSVVNDVLMPPIGLAVGGVDFSSLKLVLKHAVVDPAGKVITPETALMYGKFINNVIDFLIVALAVFALIKLINIARRKPAPAPAVPPPPTKDQELLGEIRDILKEREAV
jgi:large conductance mechanosensitive channel